MHGPHVQRQHGVLQLATGCLLAVAAAATAQEPVVRPDGRYEVRDAIDVVAPVPAAPSPGGSTLTADELAPISNHFGDWLAVSRAVSGTAGDPVVYVDGVRTRIKPLAGTVTRITIDGDPFSTEFGEARRVDVATGVPQRRLKFSLGGDLLPIGGHSVLAPSSGTTAHSATADLSSGIRGTPFVVALQGRSDGHEFAQPLVGLAAGSATTTRHAWAGTARVYYMSQSGTDLRLLAALEGDGISNADAGGIVSMDASSRTSAHSHDVVVSVEHRWRPLRARGSLVVSGTDASSAANSASAGIRVLGALTGGGAPVAAARTIDESWTWKGVIDSPEPGRWLAGAVLTRSTLVRRQWPNPAGVLQISADQYAAAAMGTGGIWFVEQGTFDVATSTMTASVFAERRVVDRRRFTLRAGVRADQQTGDGVRLLPRMSSITRLGAWDMRAGAGLFAQPLANDEFAPSLAAANGQWRQLTGSIGGPLILARSTLGADVTRSDATSLQVGFERRAGNVMPSVEYRLDAGRHLAGSQRLAGVDGWADVLRSNRRMRHSELRAGVRVRLWRQRVFANYERVDAFDDTAGPFSFPQDQRNLADEWARSAGVAMHNVQVVDMLSLPGGWSASIVGIARSGQPYNVTSGLDPSGLGLFTDRGGLGRNAGLLPSTGSLDAYASRRVALPSKFFRESHATVGIRATRLLATPIYTSLGAVLSSPLAGRPLTAEAGRSISVWMTIG